MEYSKHRTTLPRLVLAGAQPATAHAPMTLADEPAAQIAELPSSPQATTSIATAGDMQAAVARAQLTVPVSPDGQPRDTLLFEHPTGAQRYYLPRYRVAEDRVPGLQRYRVSLQADPAGGHILAIELETQIAPEIEGQAAGAQPLPHECEVMLTHRVAPEGGPQKEWGFQELMVIDGGLRATRRIADLTERDQIIAALSDRRYDAALVVRRSFTIGIPLDMPALIAPLAAAEQQQAAEVQRLADSIAGHEQALAAAQQQLATYERDLPQLQAELDRQQPLLAQTQAEADQIGRQVAEADAAVARSQQAVDTTQQHITQLQEQLADLSDAFDTPFGKPFPGAARRAALTAQINASRQTLRSQQQELNGAVARRDQLRAALADSQARANAARQQIAALSARVGSAQQGCAQQQAASAQEKMLLDSLQAGRASQQHELEQTQRQLAVLRATPLFRSATLRLDQQVAPAPFAFDRALHPYIFAALAPGSGATFALVRRDFEGQRYYQDAAQPWQFYYLPDAFKLRRKPEPPFAPFIGLSFEDSGDSITAHLSYVAAPVADRRRLKRALGFLQQFAPRSLPAHVLGPQLLPLQVDPKTLSLRLNQIQPAGSGGTGGFVQRPDAAVHLQEGIRDTLTLPLPQFKAVWDAVMSPSLSFFQGYVDVALEGGVVAIPFTPRLADTAGDYFTYEQVPTPAGVQVTLRNAIESPLTIKSLPAALVSDDGNLEARVDGLALPLRLNPGEAASCTVVAATLGASAANMQAEFNLDGVAVDLDAEKVWQAIVGPVYADQSWAIEVRTFEDFAGAVVLQQVRFGGGRSIVFEPGKPNQAQVQVRQPLADYVLGRANMREYTYSVRTFRRGVPGSAESAPATSSDNPLLIEASL